MEKTCNLMSNINGMSNNKKKSHVGRNAAIIGGAALAGGVGSAAAAASFLGSEEVVTEVEEDVNVEYVEVEPEEVEYEQDGTYSAPAYHHAPAQPEIADPIVDDVNDVELTVDSDDEPFDAVVIDDIVANEIPESFDIEFIDGNDEEFETSVIDIDDENLMDYDDDFEEIDVNFDDDTTVEDIITDDFLDSGVDTDIF